MTEKGRPGRAVKKGNVKSAAAGDLPCRRAFAYRDPPPPRQAALPGFSLPGKAGGRRLSHRL